MNRHTLFATFGCAALLAALAAWVALMVTPNITQRIAADVTQQLHLQQLDSIAVTMDGRDVALHGELPSQQHINLAMMLASHRPGVRIVMNDMVLVDNMRPPLTD